ncbi:trimeric intracellular cation channel family protein [Polaribacter sp. MSW13]|uniref:Trimeric intracellular cation channel family protein n=1 Tax=Polaribacter marinus TaxID=2916838 RepID=A0A9X2AJ86_9FLAO|nr:trimeric intracellular cation channel family protein [Polaribacter marinus]MCI2228148.1 trimeric intracellular cation channel family protein [Polaribacter marinus]
MSLIYVIDLLGTFAFALSGALVASDKKFDLFGVIIIAFVTAVGGGMLRDVLINAHPINWIGDLNYLWTILIAVIVTFLFKSKIAHLSKTMFLFDTIGISVFTLLGLEKGLAYNLHPIVALIMGMISAVFGGVLRDVLTNKIPLIFEKEIYASACLAGGISYLTLSYLGVTENIIFIISALVIVLIRIISVKFHLQLPKIKDDLFGKTS